MAIARDQTSGKLVRFDAKWHLNRPGLLHGAPVLWQRSDTEITAYVWSEKDFCRAVTYAGGKFATLQSTSQYGFPARELRMPGGILAFSADGTKDGTGIVWASHPTDDDGMNKTVKGTLRAFDARDLNVEPAARAWRPRLIPLAPVTVFIFHTW